MYVKLNDDCICHILTFLDLLDIVNCSLINKQFNIVSKNDLIWEQLFENAFYRTIKYPTNNFYKNYLKQIKIDKYIVEREIIDIDARDVNCKGRGITYLPKKIGKLTYLEKLYLQKNNIHTIPIVICKLSNLRTLNLSHNWLKIIPQEIGQLILLYEFNVSYNRIEIIPNSIGKLKHLRKLSIEANPIKSLPLEISNLKKLEKFKVSSRLTDCIHKTMWDSNILEIMFYE